MPHGGCYLWTESLMALHALSDGAIALSYYSIPFTLLYFVRRRKDLQFHWVFICFAAFVLACGTTHLMEIWNIWHANYWLSGFIKAFTALVSVPTAFLLAKLIPQALALPSANDLRKARDELENRARERTAELEKTTQSLQAEIAARKESEAALRRTDRALRTISDCHQALVRATTEPVLLSEICRVIVEQGGYRMAWVGFAENDAKKSVRVAAGAGYNEGYLEQLRLTWADTEEGQGPTGIAIRTGRLVICNDFQTDPVVAPWRAAANQRGFASSIVLPLLRGENSFGVLTIYAAKINAFNPTEIELLKELAEDLAYGIQTLRTREEQKRAEAVLQRSEQNYREIFNATNEAILLHDAATGDILDVNDAMLRLYGYASKADVLACQYSELNANISPYTLVEARDYIHQAVTEGPQVFEWRARHSNGETFWVEVSLRSSQIGGAGRILAVARDINERKQSLQLLIESEKRYHDLFAHMNEGFAFCQMIFEDGQPKDFIYLAVNEMFVTLTGLKNVVGRRISEIIPGIHASDRELLEIYGRVAATGKPEKHERYFKALQIWLELSIYSTAQNLFTVVFDVITERKRTEEEIRRLTVFAELNPNPVLEFRADGTLAYCNHAAINLSRSLSLSGVVALLPSKVEDLVRQCLATDQPQLRLETHCASRTLSSSFYPIRKTNTVHCYMGDITERKRAEEQMNVQFSALTAVANAIVITDLGGKIEWANPAFSKLTGYSAEEVIGKYPSLLKSGQQSPAFYSNLWATIITGNVWHGEIVNRRKDGQLYTEEMTITPVRGSDGQVAHFVAIKLDVTEKRELERRMQQSQKMEAIGTLAGGIAHDFNNILASMFGYTYLLQQETEGTQAAQESIEEILKATGRAKDLVQQILTFSRQREQKPQVIQLGPIVREAIKFLRASLPAQIKIELNLAADAPAVLADPTQIYQVTINLATNALHAMEGRPGQLTVSLDSFLPDDKFSQSHPEFRRIPHARLIVADTGHGMDAETLERIFEPFFTTKPVGKGTGLGLAVVHGIVQSHNAIILVDSQPGCGTTFQLYFPGENRSSASTVALDNEVPQGGGEKILLLDDEPALTAALQRLLVRLNYQVTTSNHAREAINWCKENPAQVDLVITDLTMPELTGLEVASQLHAFRPDLPIILVSGFSADINRESLEAAGICELLEKPISRRSLAETVRRVVVAYGHKVPPNGRRAE